MSEIVKLKGNPAAPVKVAELESVLNKLAVGMMEEVRDAMTEQVKQTADVIVDLRKNIANCQAEITRLNRLIETERRLRLGKRK